MEVLRYIENLGYFWKLLFAFNLGLWFLFTALGEFSRARNVSGFFILIGLLGTFTGIASALGLSGGKVEEFIKAVGLSISTSLVGIGICLQCEFLQLFMKKINHVPVVSNEPVEEKRSSEDAV